MNIIVSNNQTLYPKNLDGKFLDYMTYEMFSSDNSIIRVNKEMTYFFDVDDMPEELYESIESLIQPSDCGVNFILFKYGNDLDIINKNYPSFIKVKVIAFEPIILTKTNKFTYIDMIRLNSTTYINNYSSIIVTGDEDTGKTKLLINIVKQLSNKGVSIDFITEEALSKFIDNEYCNFHSSASVAECAKVLENAKEEIGNRFKLIQKECVNTVYNLSSIPQQKVIVIDNLKYYMDSEDYKSVDIIKQTLQYIANIGMDVNIHVIISCVKPSGSVISTELRSTCKHFIHTGPLHNDPLYAIRNSDEYKVIVSKGYAYYKLGSFDDINVGTKFKIDDVK